MQRRQVSLNSFLRRLSAADLSVPDCVRLVHSFRSDLYVLSKRSIWRGRMDGRTERMYSPLRILASVLVTRHRWGCETRKQENAVQYCIPCYWRRCLYQCRTPTVLQWTNSDAIFMLLYGTLFKQRRTTTRSTDWRRREVNCCPLYTRSPKLL